MIDGVAAEEQGGGGDAGGDSPARDGEAPDRGGFGWHHNDGIGAVKRAAAGGAAGKVVFEQQPLGFGQSLGAVGGELIPHMQAKGSGGKVVPDAVAHGGQGGRVRCFLAHVLQDLIELMFIHGGSFPSTVNGDQQILANPVKPAGDGAAFNAEHFGEFFVGVSIQIAEREELGVFGVELGERPANGFF